MAFGLVGWCYGRPGGPIVKGGSGLRRADGSRPSLLAVGLRQGLMKEGTRVIWAVISLRRKKFRDTVVFCLFVVIIVQPWTN